MGYRVTIVAAPGKDAEWCGYKSSPQRDLLHLAHEDPQSWGMRRPSPLCPPMFLQTQLGHGGLEHIVSSICSPCSAPRTSNGHHAWCDPATLR